MRGGGPGPPPGLLSYHVVYLFPSITKQHGMDKQWQKILRLEGDNLLSCPGSLKNLGLCHHRLTNEDNSEPTRAGHFKKKFDNNVPNYFKDCTSH